MSCEKINVFFKLLNLWYFKNNSPSRLRWISYPICLKNVFNIAPGVGMQAMASLFLFIWESLYGLFIFWKVFLLGIEFLLAVFIFQYFKQGPLLPSGLRRFWWEVFYKFIFVSLYVICLFPSGYLQYFCVSFLFSNLNMIY